VTSSAEQRRRAPAVFFDRDNTLVEDPGYLADPARVVLFADVPTAIVRLQNAGYRVVVVTNQSGVARGLITEEQLEAVHQRVKELLARQGAALDAIYACPYLDGPEATVEQYRRATDLRKPAPGMLLKAAHELQLDLARSWMVGDSSRDVEAGLRAGCRTILLERNGTSAARQEDARSNQGQIRPTGVVASLTEAADMILNQHSAPADPQRGGSPTSSDTAAALPPQPGELDASESAGADPKASGSPSAPEPSGSDVHSVLVDIRNLLDRTSRARRQEDFSLRRLSSTLLQMLAVVVAFWGLFALFADNGAVATARFALAIFLQLTTLGLRPRGEGE